MEKGLLIITLVNDLNSIGEKENKNDDNPISNNTDTTDGHFHTCTEFSKSFNLLILEVLHDI